VIASASCLQHQPRDQLELRAVYTLPVGLLGVLITIARVLLLKA
jgi:hypothetical protein